MSTLLFSRNLVEEFWVPTVFTGILVFCLFQLGMSIYQAQSEQPARKLHAISAFAS